MAVIKAGVLALWLVAALVAAPVAAAGTPGATESLGKAKGLEYHRARFLSVVTQTAQPANCDGDANVVGGGGSMAGSAPESTLNETYPMQPDSWQAEGSTTAPNGRTLTAYAVCAGGFSLSHQSSQSPLGVNTVIIATAACEGAEEPIAGGGGATGPGIRMIASFPRLAPSSPLGWHPFAHNTTASDTLWDSSAICSNLDVRYRESDRVRVRPQETGKAVAECRQTEAVVSGGWAGKRDKVVGFTTRALTTKPWDSKDDANKVPDDGWLAKAQNLHTQRIDLIANAVCKRPPQ
jgi:hypothetical protein